MATASAVLIFGLLLASVYIILAVGLVLVFNVLRIPNFTQASIYVLGGYTTYVLVTRFSVPALGAIPGAFLIAGILGIGLWYLVFRPMLGHTRVDMFVSAFGAFIVLNNLFQIVFGPGVYSYSLVPTVEIVPRLLPLDRLIIIVVCTLSMVALLAFVQLTSVGKAIRAVAQNPRAAEAIGIDSERISLLTLFIGTGLGGVAGALLGGITGVSPDSGTAILLKVIAILIVGGMGSIIGSVVAAVGLAVVESFVSYYASEYSEIVFFAALVLILMVRPYGLFGERELGEIN